MANHSSTRFWLWGGVTGLSLPLASFALLLACLRITSGVILALSLIIVFFLEAPPVIIVRMLNLPIKMDNEISDPIFIVYQLSPFGYIFVVVFWIFVGLLVGFVVDKLLSVKMKA